MTDYPSLAACWLNADCIRGYHGCLDEDGCQFATTSGDL